MRMILAFLFFINNLRLQRVQLRFPRCLDGIDLDAIFEAQLTSEEL